MAGEAAERVETLGRLMRSCGLCPRRCGVNRVEGERGYCRAGPEAVVASAGPHFGEEPCLVGRGGSGTIFLAGCNLRCAFCQNEDISHRVVGEEMETASLARRMRSLERGGCENINFVTPTHFTAALAAAIVEARRQGLRVPIVWNSSGYESAEVLRRLDGLVEIYMPDFKFSRSQGAARYCNAPDYPERAREAIGEMHRQVGDLVLEGGVARKGVLVRHLVMPGGAEEGCEVLDWLASVSRRMVVNVMGQYHPAGEAVRSPIGPLGAIARRPTLQEVRRVWNHAKELGLRLAE